VLDIQLSKNKKRRITIMRLLILAAAASLVITGAAMADEPGTDVKAAHHHHHNNRDANASAANAPVAEGSIPADTLSNHDAHMKNLHDSGYNPSGDVDGAGNTRQY
jgi:hypothetical protein